MTEPPSRARRSSTWLWALIVAILAPAVVLALVVPIYAKTDPELWGFPFFYWFQMLLVLVAVVCVAVAYWLSLIADRRDREDLHR
jgi:uncharacterized membrane protein